MLWTPTDSLLALVLRKRSLANILLWRSVNMSPFLAVTLERNITEGRLGPATNALLFSMLGMAVMNAE